MIKEMGADILRLWVSSADYRNDIAVSPNIMKQTSEAYRKIRNSCRFILGNIFDFDPEKDMVAYEDLGELDRWALLKIEKLLRRVTKAYEDYEFHVVFHSVHNFCTVDLSNIYFDILKDRLYCSSADEPERKAAQTVLYHLINTLVVILAPVLAFTSEEIWGYIRQEQEPDSVQLLEWPHFNDSWLDEGLESKMDKLLTLREVVSKALEEARAKKIIGHSLGAKVVILANEDWLELLKNTPDLEKILIVSQVELAGTEERTGDDIGREEVPGVWVRVEAAAGEKCERCWIIDTSVGENQQHSSLCCRCAEVVERLEI